MGGPRGQKVWKETQGRGVGQRSGEGGRNWVIPSKIPDPAGEGLGQAHSNRKLKI